MTAVLIALLLVGVYSSEVTYFEETVKYSGRYQTIDDSVEDPSIGIDPDFEIDEKELGITHDHWIQLGRRSYKIYNRPTTYDNATLRCSEHHPDGQLAVVASFHHSQILGYFLEKGHEKLSYGWIGARWYEQGYVFEPENLLLANKADAVGYPPWRRKKPERTRSCILLDRHISNITVFLEAKCERSRPYICYVRNETGYVDMLRENRGYRLHYEKLNWADASSFCARNYANYSARLAEVKTAPQPSDVIYLLRKAQAPVHNVWLGGHLVKNGTKKWVWHSDNSLALGNDTQLKWVKQSLFRSPSKKRDCVAMNSLGASYPAACKYELSFVCQFSEEHFKQLHEYEKRKKYIKAGFAM